MNEQDLIKIINLIEYPDISKTLRELGGYRYAKN